MKKNIYLVAILGVFLVILISGCTEQNPKFIMAKVEPSFIEEPFSTNIKDENRANIVYEIENPTKIDLNGKVTFIFDEECLRMGNGEREVSIEAGSIQSYNDEISAIGRDMPTKCFKSQPILLRLSNMEETISYNSYQATLTITRR